MRKALSLVVGLALVVGLVLGGRALLHRPSAGGGCATAPAYHVDRTLFGVSVSMRGQTFREAISRAAATFGDRSLVRVFDPGPPPGDAWARRTPSLGAHMPVVTSFRMAPSAVLAGQFDRRLERFFDTAPGGRPIFWSYFHEPETAVLDHHFTAAEYRAAFQHVARIAARACRSNLFPTLILTGYTADPASGRDWHDYYPGKDYVSVLAWDPYNSATTTPTSYEAPADVFDATLRDARSAGKPWALAETGSALVPGDDGAGRAAWLTQVGAFARDHHAAFVAYFNGTDKVDFRLTDGPSAQAWRDQVGG